MRIAIRTLFSSALTCVLLCLSTAQGADAPRLDVHGDPLPDGALARLGSIRWRAGNTISMTAFLPDGKSILTVSQDYIVQVWDRDSGKEVRQFDAAGPVPNNPNGPQIVLFNGGSNNLALGGDGKTLACPGRDGVIHLWDVASGKEIARLGDWRAVGRWQLALSGDGKTLALGTYAQKTTLWDTATGRELRSFGEPAGGVRLMSYKMALSSDGKRLVQSGIEIGNGGIKTCAVVWDTASGKELERFVDPAAGPGAIPAMASAISPDTKWLALPTAGKVKLIDLTTGKEARQLEGGDGQSPLVFSPDSKQLVLVAGRADALTVWDVATGKTLHQNGKAGWPGAGLAVNLNARLTAGLAVAPDGKWLACTEGPAVRLIDLETGKEKTAGAGHAGALRGVGYARDGKTLLTWADDAGIRRWHAVTGKEVGQIAVPGKVFAFIIPSPDERLLAAGEADGSVHLIEAATGKELHTIKPPQARVGRTAVFSPDSHLLGTASQMTPAVEIYDTMSGREKHTLLPPSAQAPAVPGAAFMLAVRGPHNVFFSPDSRLVATADTSFVIWDVATGREERQIALPPNAVVPSAAFSPDGRTVAIELQSGEVGVWELASAQKRLTINGQRRVDAGRTVLIHNVIPTTLAFAPDGRILAQVQELQVRLWDLRTGKEIGVFDGHRGPVTGLAFSPDGKRLATASSDTTGLVWTTEPALKKLTPLAAVLTKEKLAAHWSDLGETDAARAYAAVLALAGDPAKSVPFLGERLKPALAPDSRHVARLIADLDADEFQARESAHNELAKLGELALAPMRATLKGNPSAEQRRLLEDLVSGAGMQTPSAERLRVMRALEALELAATPEAVKVLKAMAAGAPDTMPTTQARAILARMGQK